MKLTHSCQEASRLMSRAFDEPLGWLDRMRLQVHLSLCGNCRHLDQQLRVIDGLAGDLFAHRAPGDIEPNALAGR